MTPPLRAQLPRRGLLALGLFCSLPGVLRAEAPGIWRPLDGLRWIFPAGQEARGLLKHGRVTQALTLLTRANDAIEQAAETQWPWRIYIGADLGYALLEIGRNEEALRILQLTQFAHARVHAEQLMPFLGLLQRHDTGLGQMMLGVEFRRQWLSVVVTEGDGPHTLDAQVWDTSIGTSELAFTLGRALQACGRKDELAALFLEQTDLPSTMEDNNGYARYTRELRDFRLGMLLARSGNHSLAWRAFARAQGRNFARVRETAAQVASPVALSGAIGVGRRMLSVWLGHALSPSPAAPIGGPQATELVAAILQLKGLGVRYAERLQALLGSSVNPDSQALAEQIAEIDEKMAELPVSLGGVKAMMAQEYERTRLLGQVFPELRQRGLGEVVLGGAVLLTQVRAALGHDAAIGFMVHSPLDAGDGPRITAAPPRYLRYIITVDQIDLQDIGPVAEIDRAVYRFRRDLLSGGDHGDHGAQGKQLRHRLLSGLPEAVTACERWVLDPDGALNLLPFEALGDARGQSLLHQRQIRYFTSIGQLGAQPFAAPALGSACVLANPLYPIRPPSPDAVPGLRLSQNFLRSGKLAMAPLPDTADEAQAVVEALQGLGWHVQRFEGADATAQRLLDMHQAPQVLHLACHAVLLDSSRTPDEARGAHNGLQGDNVLDMVLPGRRAALVLAGHDAPSVWLAKDFGKLPLHGTQLVVLSACDTGNGDIEPGEGLTSLRRALEQAGAASSVSSLWPVPSRASADLIGRFYRLLAQGLTKSHALQQAKLELLKTGAPPHAWAGFLLAGSDDPLTLQGVSS